MSALGQKQTLRLVGLMSALPPKADIAEHSLDVRFVPKADISWPYSITSGHTEWKSAVNFAKYDVERAEYRRDISEHVSASQEIHCPQVWV
jgi:hypothetical protein